MAGGANVSYWQGIKADGCQGPESACPCVDGAQRGRKSCPATYRNGTGQGDWGRQLRQGPPGAVAFCSKHGVLKRPVTSQAIYRCLLCWY